MLSFRQFIYLTEAKARDIIRGIVDRHIDKRKKDITDEDRKPHIERATKAYNEALKHKVNPSGFKTIDELEQATAQVKKSKEQKQASKSDIQTIHHDPKTGVTIKQVNTKDACIKEYGGGKTNWCVAATGEGNLYDRYGEGGKKFFTIHHNGNVYGAHEYEKGIIRNTENKSVKPPDVVYKEMANTPKLSKINILSQNPHTTEEHITNALKDHTDGTAARVALEEYPDKIQPHHIDMALQHPIGEVAVAALKYHKDKIQLHHIDMALQHPDGAVAEKALEDHADKIQLHHIDMAMNHPDGWVAEAALKDHKDKIKPHHIDMALQHSNGRVAEKALEYHADKIQPHHIDMALQHPNGEVSYVALYDHKDKIQPHHIDMALQHPDASVGVAALEFHKDKIKPHHIEIARRRGLL